ncbi:Uncharacterized protein dnl_21020 [Desulfonema limicola]|uniref:Uncharacterized protein n=1 Tax=Desulfonema limicola TaxID=45656 RepID=A0A975B781_9BACT|nr:hypothetical protein [Desulfonema limicola]QTA79820.1 Uncharacterized protein dnl_21020 [Desulfonema limicola]
MLEHNWYLLGEDFLKENKKNFQLLETILINTQINSLRGRIEIIVENPPNDKELKLLGIYYKMIIDFDGKVKRPWILIDSRIRNHKTALLRYEL